MGKCNECVYENVLFYKDPCYTCIRLHNDKFEPKLCAVNCKYHSVPPEQEPCASCQRNSNWESEEEKKENAEMKNTEEARSCDNCLHKDVFVFNEPCVSCVCKLEPVLHPNFVKKENAEDKVNHPSHCTNCKHIDLDASEEPCLSCWGFDKFEPKEKKENAEDKVNHPSHYTTGEIEVIDYIRDKLGCEEFTGYCIGNVMKYISRWRHKDGKQDLEKAKVYLQWAIESAEKEGAEV